MLKVFERRAVEGGDHAEGLDAGGHGFSFGVFISEQELEEITCEGVDFTLVHLASPIRCTPHVLKESLHLR